MIHSSSYYFSSIPSKSHWEIGKIPPQTFCLDLKKFYFIKANLADNYYVTDTTECVCTCNACATGSTEAGWSCCVYETGLTVSHWSCNQRTIRPTVIRWDCQHITTAPTGAVWACRSCATDPAGRILLHKQIPSAYLT